MIQPYGGLTDIDADIIEQAIRLAASLHTDPELTVVEVGTFNGQTACGIKNCIEGLGRKINYWGVDNGTQSNLKPPFDGGRMISGDSAEVFHLAPEKIHFLFIDGCHCGNHVILDTLHYGQRVLRNGVMVFHDTGEYCQHTMKDPHGPHIPWFHNSVNAAHKLMRFPFPEWKKVFEGFDPQRAIGGTTAYQKL